MAKKPSIAIVGPGSLGAALAAALHEACYTVNEIVAGKSAASRRRAREIARRVRSRSAQTQTSRLDADIVWFCVPDREIAAVARELAGFTNWKGKIALHSSGALGSAELTALRNQGARVASVHPLMTFVRGSSPRLAGVPFAVEGDPAAVRAAKRLVRDLGGEVFTIAAGRKSAYHAWSTFTSPLLLALLVISEEVAALAGMSRASARRRMMPIVQQTLANYAAFGSEGAFSGPIIRGDVETVSRHLRILKKAPAAREVYLALARSALKNLPVGNRKAMQELLRRQHRGSVPQGTRRRNYTPRSQTLLRGGRGRPPDSRRDGSATCL